MLFLHILWAGIMRWVAAGDFLMDMVAELQFTDLYRYTLHTNY